MSCSWSLVTILFTSRPQEDIEMMIFCASASWCTHDAVCSLWFRISVENLYPFLNQHPFLGHLYSNWVGDMRSVMSLGAFLGAVKYASWFYVPDIFSLMTFFDYLDWSWRAYALVEYETGVYPFVFDMFLSTHNTLLMVGLKMWWNTFRSLVNRAKNGFKPFLYLSPPNLVFGSCSVYNTRLILIIWFDESMTW